MNCEITAVTTYALDRDTGTRRAVTRSIIVETKSRVARKARDSRKPIEARSWAQSQEATAPTSPIRHATRDLTRMKAADQADTVSSMLLGMRHRPNQSRANHNQSE